VRENKKRLALMNWRLLWNSSVLAVLTRRYAVRRSSPGATNAWRATLCAKRFFRSPRQNENADKENNISERVVLKSPRVRR